MAAGYAIKAITAAIANNGKRKRTIVDANANGELAGGEVGLVTPSRCRCETRGESGVDQSPYPDSDESGRGGTVAAAPFNRWGKN